MKANILPIAKSAMKYFFDIDPVLTETVMMQALAHGQLLHNGLRHTLASGVQQRSARIINLITPHNHSWNAA